MSRLGPLPIGVPALPGDVVRALRMLPQIVETTREIAAHTSRLADVSDALERVSADTETLPSMREDMKTIARAMPDLVEVQRHVAQLPETIDRLSDLMERILVAIEGLDTTIETLQEAVEPVGRLARRVPGQRKPE